MIMCDWLEICYRDNSLVCTKESQYCIMTIMGKSDTYC